MTRQDLICKICELMIQDLELVKAKNNDYSSDEDALENFKDFGVQGIVTRIGDKYHRLKTFAKKGRLECESAEDSFRDNGIYSYIARVILKEEKNKHENNEG